MYAKARRRRGRLTALAVLACLLSQPVWAETLSRKHKRFYREATTLSVSRLLDLTGKGGNLGDVAFTYNMVRSHLEVDWLYDGKPIGHTVLERGMSKEARFHYGLPASGVVEVRFTGPKGRVQVTSVRAELHSQHVGAQPGTPSEEPVTTKAPASLPPPSASMPPPLARAPALSLDELHLPSSHGSVLRALQDAGIPDTRELAERLQAPETLEHLLTAVRKSHPQTGRDDLVRTLRAAELAGHLRLGDESEYRLLDASGFSDVEALQRVHSPGALGLALRMAAIGTGERGSSLPEKAKALLESVEHVTALLPRQEVTRVEPRSPRTRHLPPKVLPAPSLPPAVHAALGSSQRAKVNWLVLRHGGAQPFPSALLARLDEVELSQDSDKDAGEMHIASIATTSSGAELRQSYPETGIWMEVDDYSGKYRPFARPHLPIYVSPLEPSKPSGLLYYVNAYEEDDRSFWDRVEAVVKTVLHVLKGAFHAVECVASLGSDAAACASFGCDLLRVSADVARQTVPKDPDDEMGTAGAAISAQMLLSLAGGGSLEIEGTPSQRDMGVAGALSHAAHACEQFTDPVEMAMGAYTKISASKSPKKWVKARIGAQRVPLVPVNRITVRLDKITVDDIREPDEDAFGEVYVRSFVGSIGKGRVGRSRFGVEDDKDFSKLMGPFDVADYHVLDKQKVTRGHSFTPRGRGVLFDRGYTDAAVGALYVEISSFDDDSENNDDEIGRFSATLPIADLRWGSSLPPAAFGDLNITREFFTNKDRSSIHRYHIDKELYYRRGYEAGTGKEFGLRGGRVVLTVEIHYPPMPPAGAYTAEGVLCMTRSGQQAMLGLAPPHPPGDNALGTLWVELEGLRWPSRSLFKTPRRPLRMELTVMKREGGEVLSRLRGEAPLKPQPLHLPTSAMKDLEGLRIRVKLLDDRPMLARVRVRLSEYYLIQ